MTQPTERGPSGRLGLVQVWPLAAAGARLAPFIGMTVLGWEVDAPIAGRPGADGAPAWPSLLPVDHPEVSGRHARLWSDGRTMTLADLGSTNGTFRNGEPLAGPEHKGEQGPAVALKAQDVIRLGGALFVVETHPDVVDGPATHGHSTWSRVDRHGAFQRAKAGHVIVDGPPGAGRAHLAEELITRSSRAIEALVAYEGTAPDAPALTRGQVRQAEGGTLLLLNVDRVPPSRLEALRTSRDVRVIATAAERWRPTALEGLLAREFAARVTVPGLSRRRADIPALTCARLRAWHQADDALDANTVEHLMCGTYPENLRALFEALEALVPGATAEETTPTRPAGLAIVGRRCVARWYGQTHTFRADRGFVYLVELLRRAPEAVSATTLSGRVESSVRRDPVYDRTAMASIRKDDASSRFAGRDVGLHGPRDLDRNREAARKAVKMALDRALDQLEAAVPAMAEHLRSSLSTGHQCAYTPPPGAGVEWEV
jgi:hypothetical protein